MRYRVTVTTDDGATLADITLDDADFWLHGNMPGGVAREILLMASDEVL